MITVLSIVACAITMCSSWLVSQGKLKPVYVLGIINALCFIVINISLAFHDAGALFLVIPSAWGIVTSIIGLRRLYARSLDSE